METELNKKAWKDDTFTNILCISTFLNDILKVKYTR